MMNWLETQKQTSRKLFDQYLKQLHRERRWLALPLLAGAILYALRITLPQGPLGIAGLYLTIVEEIIANGFQLPHTIPNYTAEGIPFAYPPLSFYLTAIIHSTTGISLLTIARILPGLFIITSTVPLYYLGREALSSRWQASLAATIGVIFLFIDPSFISTGGLVRAPGLFFFLSGVYAGYRLFTSHERRWMILGGVLFSLTVLSHPGMGALFIWSYLTIYAYYDRSLPGLLAGGVVPLIALALMLPWWGSVAVMHGTDIFLQTLNTYSNGRSSGTLARLLNYGEIAAYSLTLTSDQLRPPYGNLLLWYLAFFGAVVELLRRKAFFVLWSVVLFVVRAGDLVIIPQAFLAAVGLFAITDGFPEISANRNWTRIVIIGLVILASVTTAGNQVADSTTRISPNEVNAMEWAEENTPPDATFIVVGGTHEMEWFGYYADRTNLIGHWGVEWKGPDQVAHQLRLERALRGCGTASCVSKITGEEGLTPSHIYVVGREKLQGSLKESDGYNQIHQDGHVSIYRVNNN